MKIKYIGTNKILDVKPGKLYEARRSTLENEKSWILVIDESGEEYTRRDNSIREHL